MERNVLMRDTIGNIFWLTSERSSLSHRTRTQLILYGGL